MEQNGTVAAGRNLTRRTLGGFHQHAAAVHGLITGFRVLIHSHVKTHLESFHGVVD